MSKLPEGITAQEVQAIGELAAKVVIQVFESGIAWDHAVTALGMATKSLAVGMPWEDQANRIDHAQKAFGIGFNQKVRIAYVDVSGHQIEIGSPDEAKQKLTVPGAQARIVFD
ncbi:hypothetical protein [Pseudoduganella sp. OTU4001]|uniref:hypothetical protein n=1 Tax=Pseudoduganella sp. OTU4001 TaxID=3043854 RepID=UPI00313D7CE2